jgi:hypothetical protein
MDELIVAESDGRSGGLVMPWKNEVKLQENNIHTNYIDAIVDGDNDETKWRLTGIYGESSWENKYKTWERLRELHGMIEMRWLVIGDWNEILYSHEKEGAIRDPCNICKLFGTPFQIVVWRTWATLAIPSCGEERGVDAHRVCESDSTVHAVTRLGLSCSLMHACPIRRG